MLPRQYRLVGEKNFVRLKKYGRLYKGEFLGLIAYKSNRNTNSRIGFTVSLKVSKRAIERNKLRRKLREIVFPLVEKLGNGYDLLFLAKSKSLAASGENLREEVTRLLKESGGLG